jgi:phosphatidylserine decarboxylase
MAEFEPVRYHSFAEFFDRRFRPGARKFPSAPEEMGAFAEARYFGWRNVEPDQKFPVKGHSLNAAQILGSADRARQFVGGPVLLVRLAPLTTTTCIIPMTERRGTISAWAAGSGP